jgi:hypothetical protein
VAVTFLTGFEGRDGSAVVCVDGVYTSGAGNYSTVQKRTGSYAFRCNPISAAQGYGGGIPTGSNYPHFGLYIATLPTVDRRVYGKDTAGSINVRLTSAGKLAVYLANVLIGTGSTTLATATWYWIGVRQVTGTSVALLQINGATEITGTATVTVTSAYIGCFGTEASAIDVYFDDLIVDDTGFLAASKVALLVPISDNSITPAGWVLGGAGGTTNLYLATDNTPPVGAADPGTTTGQIRDATANLSAYAANLTTYTTAGIGASDTILACQGIFMTAAPSATTPKSGSMTIANPTQAKTTIGTFYATAIAGAYATGWARKAGAIIALPTVTLGSSPVLTVTQDTSSTSIADVCFMGLLVAWTPASGPASKQQSLTAGLSFAGGGWHAVASGKTAGLSFVGTTKRATAKTLVAAALSFVGSLSAARAFLKALAASVSFVGAQGRAIGTHLAAGLSFVGSLRRATAKGMTAALTFTGSIGKGIVHGAFTAALTFAGGFTAGRALLRTLTGGLTFVGTLPRAIGHHLTGGLSFVGGLPRAVGTRLAAALSFVGTLSTGGLHFFNQNLAAGLTFSGTVLKGTGKRLTAAVSFSGALTAGRAFLRTMTGALTFTGALGPKAIGKALTAGLAFGGGLRRQIATRLTATLTFAGTIAKGLPRTFTAGLSFVGTIRKGTGRQMAAALTFSGAVGAVRQAAALIVKALATIRDAGLALAMARDARTNAAAPTDAGAATGAATDRPPTISAPSDSGPNTATPRDS